MTQQKGQQQDATPRFTFQSPYSTFLPDGTQPETPYVIDGLLTQGGLSVLAAKSKQGKSSIARCAAVAVSKGTEFLGRSTTQGGCLIINLEDPLNHVDNCLKVLGYDESTDAQIRIVSKLFPTLNENIDALGAALKDLPNLRLVVIDHIAKFIKRGIDDMNDSLQVSTALEKLLDLARTFPHLHILCLAHCKKIQPEDPFDGVLGSQSFRAETDSNILIYMQDGERLITAETRTGRRLDPTLLHAELITSAGADVVRSFTLGKSASEKRREKSEKKENAEKRDKKREIVEFLKGCDDLTATQESLTKSIVGRKQDLIEHIKELQTSQVLAPVETKPLTLKLDLEMWNLWEIAGRATNDGGIVQ